MSPSKPLWVLAPLLSCVLLASSSGWAAPKAGATKRSPATNSSPRVKWEYCYVVTGAYVGGKHGIAAYLPQGRQIFIPYSPGGYATGYVAIAQMLNRLGDQGWQIVSYQDASSQSWILSRRK